MRKRTCIVAIWCSFIDERSDNVCHDEDDKWNHGRCILIVMKKKHHLCYLELPEVIVSCTVIIRKTRTSKQNAVTILKLEQCCFIIHLCIQKMQADQTAPSRATVVSSGSTLFAQTCLSETFKDQYSNLAANG